MQMARATSEGVKNWMGEKRPFVLTRSAFSGIQRYSAIWTGDNVESDEHMIAGIRLVNNLGLAGVPFAGYDIGGYVGDPSPALFARWISHGVFSPLCRGHSGINTKSAEPWTFGEEAEKIARNYIKFRYRLLPYLYSLFYESARTGLPVSRSMVIDHPHDPEIYKDPFQNQFYFGPWILVAPVASGEHISRVYLPQGKWYHYLTEKAEWGKSQIYVDTPVDKIPVFFRAGGIVPMVEPRSTTTESMKGTLQVHIYSADDDFPYVFEYYEDDGVTDRHLDGRFFKRQIRYEKNRLVLEKATGSYQTKFDKLKVCFHGFHFEKQKAVYIDGNKTVFEKEPFRLFYPVYLFTDDFDPYGEVVIDTISLEHSGQYSQIVWDR
jgi:alpha-glucosidase